MAKKRTKKEVKTLLRSLQSEARKLATRQEKHARQLEASHLKAIKIINDICEVLSEIGI